MSRGEHFAGLRAYIKDSFEKKMKKYHSDVLQGVQKVFNMIVEDFTSNFAVEETPDPKRDLLRSEIQEFVDYAQAIINGPLATELATAMADSE